MDTITFKWKNWDGIHRACHVVSPHAFIILRVQKSAHDPYWCWEGLLQHGHDNDTDDYVEVGLIHKTLAGAKAAAEAAAPKLLKAMTALHEGE